MATDPHGQGNNTARVSAWDGQPSGRCDHIGCANPPVVHFEMSGGDDWAAESDLCAEHLPEIAGQAQAFAVAIGAVSPTSELDRNIRAATSEHMS